MNELHKIQVAQIERRLREIAAQIDELHDEERKLVEDLLLRLNEDTHA